MGASCPSTWSTLLKGLAAVCSASALEEMAPWESLDKPGKGASQVSKAVKATWEKRVLQEKEAPLGQWGSKGLKDVMARKAPRETED